MKNVAILVFLLGILMAYYYGADSSYTTSSDYQEATSLLGSLWINTEPNSTKVLFDSPTITATV